MENKTTEELHHEIKASTDIEDYLKTNQNYMIADTLPDYLNRMLSQKGLNRADVVRR